jgi:predicted homoserine dehydrogenase-like protein
LRWGVYLVVEAQSDYAAACFQQYGLLTDVSGRFAAMYRPFHLIGMELGISLYAAVLRGEPTAAPMTFRGDVVAIAKRDLEPGEHLDGEGGFTVWGKLVPARRSVAEDALPIGLAKDVPLTRAVCSGSVVRTSDVVLDKVGPVLDMRHETCAMLGD